MLDEPSLSAHSKMIADKLAVSELMSMAVVALPPVVRVSIPPFWQCPRLHCSPTNLLCSVSLSACWSHMDAVAACVSLVRC